MTYNITLTANHQSLTAKYLPLAAESVQYLTAKVVYETDDWTGREIKAMFEQGRTVYKVPVIGGEITAKQQLNLTAGDWRVWLVGNSARDGDVIPRITTNIAHIIVAPTGGTEGNPFPTVPPTVEEQLRADMGNLADLTTEDKSSLVAAINEAAASGGSKDAVTYTPQTLTEEQQEQARTNIGAEKAGTGYTKPASGIPKTDLADDVQTSLAKADTAISYDSQTLTEEQKSQARTNIGAGQPDWNQNDSTQPDYVKNRPFYTGDTVETVLVEESTVSFTAKNGMYMGRLESTFSATVGETYKVYWDGAAYECACVDFHNIPFIGNLSIMGESSDTGEPFAMGILNGMEIQIVTPDTSASHTISISELAPEVVKIDKKYLVQPDWNQNDSTQPDYVKNRPFYTGDPVETVIVEESTVSFVANEGIYMGELKSTFSATVGETYKVYWDGTAYECTCVKFNGNTVIGNLSIAGAGSDTGEPFVMSILHGNKIRIITADTSASHTVSISGFVPKVVKIDEKYLPNTVATKSEVEAARAMANAALERTVEPYTGDTQMAPLYKNGGFSAWRKVVQEIGYDETEGYFFVNEFDTTALKGEGLPDGVFCVSGYVGDQDVTAFLSRFFTTGHSWFVRGFAVIANENSRAGELLYVVSNTIPESQTRGIFLTLRAPDSMLLKSSTTNSAKQFRITVDNSGVPTITDESDSTNTWKPTNLPTVTSSDSGKFLRVSDTGEWVAETILSASGVSF